MSSDKSSSSELLKTLEMNLRGYIRYKLSAIDPNWWKTRVPTDVRNGCEVRMEKHDAQWPWCSPPDSHPIAFANFNDYLKIISRRSNWEDAFKAILGEKRILEGKLRELEIARPVIAHNRPFPNDAKKQFELNTKHVLKLISSDQFFKGFKNTVGDDWQRVVEGCREEDVILILAGNPWLLGESTYFKERNVPLERKQPDLLFEDDNGFQTFVEVESTNFDLEQILNYARLLSQKLKQKQCRLVWFVPESFKLKVGKALAKKFTRACIDTIWYNRSFFTKWAYARHHARASLDALYSYLSKPFTYTVGRKGHHTYEHTFTNVIDALYFYGYTEGSGKKRKVGFHLATLGWNLDLLRNLSSPNSRYSGTNPELLAKIIIEILEYPYPYKDPKATPRQKYRPLWLVDHKGFINHLANYKKKGRIDYIKEELKSRHRALRDFYETILIPIQDDIRSKYPLADPSSDAIRIDLLELIARRVANAKMQMDVLPAGQFRDGIVDHLALEEPELTERIGTGSYEAKNTRTEARGTYRANMAKRIVEVMSLKRIIEVHASIVPTYQILVIGRKGPRVQGVQTFRPNKDVRFRRDLLR